MTVLEKITFVQMDAAMRMIEWAIQTPNRWVTHDGSRTAVMWVSDLDQLSVSTEWANDGDVTIHPMSSKYETGKVIAQALKAEDSGRLTIAPARTRDFQVNHREVYFDVRVEGQTMTVWEKSDADYMFDHMFPETIEITMEIAWAMIDVYLKAWKRGQVFGRDQKSSEIKRALGL